MAMLTVALYTYYRCSRCHLNEARWARHAALPRLRGLLVPALTLTLTLALPLPLPLEP